jgi:hypothetical protein
VAGVATDTTIDVDSITGISSGDTIGVEVANNVMHWTTVNGAPSGDTVTLTDQLPSASAIDSQVYYFTKVTTAAAREMPLIIDSAYRRDPWEPVNDTQGIDVPMTYVEQTDYEDLSIKTTDGVVNNYYYDPQRLEGNFYVWPETSDETQFVNMWVQRPIEDFDAAGDEPDYPQEWFLTLAYNLAKYSLVKFGADQARANIILGLAEETLRDSLAADSEKRLLLRPDERGSI